MSKVYVQHDCIPMFIAMKIRAADIVDEKISRSGIITIGIRQFEIKKEKPGIIIVIAFGSSGNIICDYLGSAKNKEERNGKRKPKIRHKNQPGAVQNRSIRQKENL